MSVAINIKCESVEKMHELREKMHLGLKGSPAYINSEIAICDLQDDAFTLIVGNYNEEHEKVNVEYDVHGNNLLERQL